MNNVYTAANSHQASRLAHALPTAAMKTELRNERGKRRIHEKSQPVPTPSIKLPRVQRIVPSLFRKQFRVVAALHDFAVFQYEYFVGVAHGSVGGMCGQVICTI